MSHITTCPRFGGLYDAASELQAASPSRLCLQCAEFLAFAHGSNPTPDDKLTWYRFGKSGRKVPCDPPQKVAA